MTDWVEEDTFGAAVPGCAFPGLVVPGQSEGWCDPTSWTEDVSVYRSDE